MPFLTVSFVPSPFQAGLLGEQRLAHHFRKRALDHLLRHHRKCGEGGGGADEARAVRVFLEPLGHDVPAEVPAPMRAGEKALDLADRHKGLLRDDVCSTRHLQSHSPAPHCSTHHLQTQPLTITHATSKTSLARPPSFTRRASF